MLYYYNRKECISHPIRNIVNDRKSVTLIYNAFSPVPLVKITFSYHLKGKTSIARVKKKENFLFKANILK